MAEARPGEAGFADVNGARLYYEVAGEGHPLVLLHGGLVDRRMWDGQFGVFAEGFRVIRYDARGYGNSETGIGTYSNHEDLHGLLRFLDIPEAYLLGLSGGGLLAIDFTLAYPEMVDALIPVAPGLSGYTWSDAMQQYGSEMGSAFERGDLSHALELWLRTWTDGPTRTPDEVDPAVRERVREMTAHAFGRFSEQATLEPLEPPAISRLAEIHVPTLILPVEKPLAERSWRHHHEGNLA
ncbi:MAG: alpha/beta hydrolase [Chloroflexota bacterium]|nr:alpha/beta hydrolase [Chloroflexota bacterium]